MAAVGGLPAVFSYIKHTFPFGSQLCYRDWTGRASAWSLPLGYYPAALSSPLALSITQEEQQPAGQEGLQQPKKVACLLRKL